MGRDNIVMIGTILAIALILLSGSLVISNMSGVSPPYTVIESQSMQHSDESQIGVIDTADMVLVRNQEKTEIITYVEGVAEDYRSFGDYGSVIIYKRPIGNPVIHRAILWLDHNENGTWSAPSLEKYPYWDNGSNTDYNQLEGILTIHFESNSEYRKVKSVSIHLDLIENTNPHGGFVTMGDNNGDIDQNSSISPYNLISKDKIKSVAWKEIPWIGAIKLALHDDIDKVQKLVPNTIPNLCAFIFTTILTVISVGVLVDIYGLHRIKKR